MATKPRTTKPRTVDEYLDALPPDRRAAVQRIRDVILANIDKDIEEGIHYGMIGYCIPHARYPAGYHCDPSQPLFFAGLASGKSSMSLHLSGCYLDEAWKERFVKAWKATGKKLDMGAACIRFKSIDQVPLEVVAETLGLMSTDAYIARYEAVLNRAAPRKPGAAKGRSGAGKSARGTAGRSAAARVKKTSSRVKKVSKTRSRRA